MTRWAILTGEYPPQTGGVSDYTRQVATGLAAAGDDVTVYAPPVAGPSSGDPGVALRRLPDRFGPRGLPLLDRALRRSRPDRILLQYVPHAFGWKAMNLPFAAWLAARACRVAPLWVMFHEVMYPIHPGQPLPHAVLARVNRTMARRIAAAAERVFVSIPTWADLLRQIGYSGRPAEWLPIPSNVPAACDPGRAAAVRSRIAAGGTRVVGHFGTYGALTAGLVGPPLIELLRRSADRVILLVGRHGDRFRDRMTAECPDIRGRVVATGGLPAADVAAHLAACDLLVQPYPDGVSSRRGSVMAGLALGVPTVTNDGAGTEPDWRSDGHGIVVTPSADAACLVAAAEAVLAMSPAERSARGKSAAAWYHARFAPELTIARLRSAAATPVVTA